MSGKHSIAEARIGTGGGYFVAGWVSIVLGVFIGIASTASIGGSGATFATLFVAAGVALLAVGFWTKLFGLVELRLIDIQRTLAPQEPPTAPVEPAAPQA